MLKYVQHFSLSSTLLFAQITIYNAYSHMKMSKAMLKRKMFIRPFVHRPQNNKNKLKHVEIVLIIRKSGKKYSMYRKKNRTVYYLL